MRFWWSVPQSQLSVTGLVQQGLPEQQLQADIGALRMGELNLRHTELDEVIALVR